MSEHDSPPSGRPAVAAVRVIDALPGLLPAGPPAPDPEPVQRQPTSEPAAAARAAVPAPASIRIGEPPPQQQAQTPDPGPSRQVAPPPPRPAAPPPLVPKEPRSWEALGLDPAIVEQLALRYFLAFPTASARELSAATAVAVPLLKEMLEALRGLKLLQHRGSTKMGEFIYELTEAGRQKAVDARKATTYVGPAPVQWTDFLEAVKHQSPSWRRPGPDDLKAAFADLLISEQMLERLGPAVSSGRAMFLHGDPGNGKTSIAERMTRCFGDEIWIPYTLYLDGHFVKLFDPAVHDEVEVDPKLVPVGERIDRRWVRIKRPTVIVGGELTLDMLDIQPDPKTNVAEPPLQLKACCGTLVVDDFGRGKTEPRDLLNRWIFPLEKRIDFLRLPDGRKVSTPFDCLLVFSTNLQPMDLADEAFLRRIPYKIRVDDPDEDEFRQVLEGLAESMDVHLPKGSVNYLIERHYKMTDRAMRFCHPRDLLIQIVHLCTFEQRKIAASPKDWDRVVSNYFGVV